MPLIWIGVSALAGVISGIVYEKETGEQIVQQPTGNTPSFSWWDKTLMAAAGIAAYYIYRSSK